MNRFLLTSLVSLGLCALVASPEVRAQGGSYPVRPAFGTYRTPTVSPYLNLLRPGSSTALNYYNLVRPDLEYYSGIQQLQSQVAINQQNIAAEASGPPTTGHPVGYFTHLRYFQTLGRGAGFNRGPTGGMGAGVARPAQTSTMGGMAGAGGTAAAPARR